MSGYTLAAGLRTLRRRESLPVERRGGKGVAAVPRGIDPQGNRESRPRVPGLRPRMHPRNAPRRADGVIGRRLRGLLSLCEVNRAAMNNEPRLTIRHPGRDHATSPPGLPARSPSRTTPAVLLAHGGGGTLTQQLDRKNVPPAALQPDARLTPRRRGVRDRRRARSRSPTDSYVVNPSFFPGGDIGDARGERDRQ